MLNRRKRRQRLQLLIAGLAGLMFIGVAAFANYQYLELQAARIPASIREELTFSPFVLRLDAKGYTVTNYRAATAEDNTQIFSYIIHTNDKTITITEYSQPPQFTDIPEYKDRFLTNVIKQNATVQTSNGTIYLGKLTKQNDKQLGIMLERGLIVMMNPGEELSPAEWRRLGEQIEIQRISN